MSGIRPLAKSDVVAADDERQQRPPALIIRSGEQQRSTRTQYPKQLARDKARIFQVFENFRSHNRVEAVIRIRNFVIQITAGPMDAFADFSRMRQQIDGMHAFKTLQAE